MKNVLPTFFNPVLTGYLSKLHIKQAHEASLTKSLNLMKATDREQLLDVEQVRYTVR